MKFIRSIKTLKEIKIIIESWLLNHRYKNLNSSDIPIVIISWNCLTFIKSFVQQIERLPNPIIILDNNSTYPALHEHYTYLERTLGSKITIKRLKKNHGHNVYKKLKHKLPKTFILSDPDLKLNPLMPHNVSQVLYSISNKYQKFKVGLSLDISDSDQFYQMKNYYRGLTIKEAEEPHWVSRIDDSDYEMYHADIDTTFTLINWKFYNKKNKYNNIRIAGNFTAKHLPWYKDFCKTNIPEIERKYLTKDNISSTTIKMTESFQAHAEHCAADAARHKKNTKYILLLHQWIKRMIC